jgi:hypothetical protein
VASRDDSVVAHGSLPALSADGRPQMAQVRVW